MIDQAGTDNEWQTAKENLAAYEAGAKQRKVEVRKAIADAERELKTIEKELATQKVDIGRMKAARMWLANKANVPAELKAEVDEARREVNETLGEVLSEARGRYLKAQTLLLHKDPDLQRDEAARMYLNG